MDLIHHLVGRHDGDRVSYVDPAAGEVTYRELHEAAGAYAARLRDSGVPRGSRCLIVSDDSVAAVTAVLGTWWHGCVPVPVSPVLRESEIVFMAKDSGAVAAHIDAPPAKERVLREELSSLVRLDGAEAGTGTAPEPAVFAADDEVLVQYTSGSTGTPRGVRHGLAGVAATLAGFGAHLGLTPDDVVVSTAKLSFGYGFGNSLLFPLAAGASVVLLGGAVDPYVVATALNTHRPTVLCSVPRVYAGLVALAEQVSAGSLRRAVSAGEHLPAELAERFTATFGVPLVNGLGATEVLHIVVATDPGRTEPGSTGRAVAGVEVTVRDEDGEVVPDGVDGRLHIAAGSVALGYIDRPDATARTFARGGAYTGDIVHRTPEGDVRHLCRADDLLNLGGYKVSPAEIEKAVRGTEGVADCAVVGETDDNGLQQAIAYAVPVAGVGAADLRQAILRSVRADLAPFKRPARIEVLDQLPVTSTGKLARFKLRSTGVAK
ncbi:AMP-binding protein [Saccharothrix sp. BKS2]|uniref:AMP-binding protein n=1 Tax=Saccharothrix sp. BKS2 TaxID=3064400 RepID=UPI0039EC36CB